MCMSIENSFRHCPQTSLDNNQLHNTPDFLLFCETKLRESSRNIEVKLAVLSSSIKGVRFVLQASKGRSAFECNRT